jgi:hypothetical protein
MPLDGLATHIYLGQCMRSEMRYCHYRACEFIRRVKEMTATRKPRSEASHEANAYLARMQSSDCSNN